MSRFLLDLRKRAVAIRNAERSQMMIPTQVTMPMSLAPCARPYASIVRWNMECLAEDPDTPAAFGSMTGITEHIEGEFYGDIELHPVHRETPDEAQ
ncbi:hypothetical protein DAEQUDRAFT_262552 [Daedalea quercina L-15889]|uniref:Uncharacterized protein n=1 Tax=Daedalea quercina L-15889 TaxID=1314783 RepID=A0A165QEY3_9APHY|nr:hypothetical protein DAEQUDRAFT_262552 [Daedalea quercina L-15889]